VWEGAAEFLTCYIIKVLEAFDVVRFSLSKDHAIATVFLLVACYHTNFRDTINDNKVYHTPSK
jgi:hypothetical protein